MVFLCLPLNTVKQVLPRFTVNLLIRHHSNKSGGTIFMDVLSCSSVSLDINELVI